MAQPSLRVEMAGTGPDEFGWRFSLEYDKLGAIAQDIAQAAESFASLMGNTPGSATADDPAYTVTFSVVGPDMPEQFKRGKDKIEGRAGGLQYSEMLALQDAGIELLRQLQVPGHNEVAAGQRK